jgi:hypothetical protein
MSRLRLAFISLALALVSASALASGAVAASKLYLSMNTARRGANQLARQAAIKNNDDGYRVGVCSRFSNVNVHCSVHSWGYHPSDGFGISCNYTIVIRWTATGLWASGRNSHCSTYG